MKTTAEKINEILAESTRMADAATPGPWIQERMFGDWGFPWVNVIKTEEQPGDDGLGITLRYGGELHCMGPLDIRNQKSSRDATFIASARTDLPARGKALRVAVEALSKFGGNEMGTCPCRECNASRAVLKILTILKGE